MSEWKTVKLNKGKTYGGLSGKSAKDFVSGDSPYVTFMEVLSNVKLTKPPTAKVKIKSGESQNIVKKNDLLLNGSSETPEEVAIPTSVNFSSDIPIYLNSFCFGYRPDTDDIDSDFLSYFLRSSEGREIIVQLAAGSTRYNISKRSFTNLELLLPPLPEQQRIARVLGDIDDEIATLEELVAKKRLVKTAVMQQLLTGKVRLTADGCAVSGAEIERERQLGHLHDWRRFKLGEIGEIAMCKRIMKHQTSEIGEIPFYKIGTFGEIPDAFIGRDIFDRYSAMYKYPNKGDILLSAAGTIGRAVVFDGKPAYFQDSNIVWLQNNEKIVSNKLLAYVYRIVKWTTSDTTISRLYNDLLLNIEIFIPIDKDEQTRIANVLTDIDDDISMHEKLISKKRQVKTGVMQQLLTGKTRLLEVG